ncbi:MAG TPA: alpha-2-macroglobulin family protein, partial [Chitinophagaceae bacterium]|nr:alpha-2-macroglobulin family protein [Chitinophagaceae bacterium]
SETWKVKITGNNHQKVEAELLASMYDLSLDNFVPHQWDSFNTLYPDVNGSVSNWSANQNFQTNHSKDIYHPKHQNYPNYNREYPSLKRFGLGQRHYRNLGRKNLALRKKIGFSQATPSASLEAVSDTRVESMKQKKSAGKNINEESSKIPSTSQAPVQIRKNFNETAFFYPQLRTDTKGNISFTFTSPEALTKWKLMLLAHTKDMEFAYSQKQITTQKPLMIQLSTPRFVRQGDQIIFSAKVSNLSKEQQKGNAMLSLQNTTTGAQLSIIKQENKKPFSVQPGTSTSVSWTIEIPKDYTGALTYTVKAVADNFSDGAKDILPVLSNKTEITTSLPFHFSGNGSHQIQWDVLSKLNTSDIQPEQITLEYTSNPIWYVVQALPFIDHNAREGATALFQEIYANSLSSYVATQIPHFKAVTQKWLQADTNALKSPLQKNQELKTVLLKQTPWVRNAQSETTQKALIANWYQTDDTKSRLKEAILSLEKLQLRNGGFSWFEDLPDSRLITQQILTGLGHLKTLQAWPSSISKDLKNIAKNAVPYLDNRMLERYKELKENDNMEDKKVSALDIQYLYMRSFFPNISISKETAPAYQYFYNKAKEQWVQKNSYTKAMLALTFHRKRDETLAQKVLTSLKETMIEGNYGGLHWKKEPKSYYWYQAPIATQAIAIEAFSALKANKDTINALRNWLLTQKQSHYWKTDQATANAVYALLLNGTQWSDAQPSVKIQIGDSSFVFGNGTYGLQYKKVHISKEGITPDMNDIQIDISQTTADQPSWGAAYFQYFANMNKVDNGGSELHIERQISKESNTDEGQVLEPISTNTTLKVGDKVQIRLIVKADRDMDFVHFKDIRASCMEPLQVLSGHQYQDGLSYYSTVNDAAVNYYFQQMSKGTYVFTYSVYITQSGNFTGGLSQIESLYAPEIRAHSEGMRLQVKK